MIRKFQLFFLIIFWACNSNKNSFDKTHFKEKGSWNYMGATIYSVYSKNKDSTELINYTRTKGALQSLIMVVFYKNYTDTPSSEEEMSKDNYKSWIGTYIRTPYHENFTNESFVDSLGKTHFGSGKIIR